MTYDLVIRSGTVVDGTGVPPRTADVAVSDGMIVEVGKVTARGHREISADGAIVTPGFVDVHTHYDGQATWDHRLQPSSAHGVTTVITGNCGVGFAPVRATDRDQLVEIMEGVEDLPGSVLHEGLSWDWESIEDYLDVLSERHFDVDIATQVCHAPVRLHVMGQRGADGEPATADDIAAMARLVADGIRAGALGFSTSRTINHRTSTGADTPTLRAERDELVGIAAAVGATGLGVLQVVSDFSNFATESETLIEMMRASSRPLSISLVQGAPGTGYRRLLRLLDDANSAGYTMRGQVAARAVGVLIGLEGTVNPLRATTEWAAVEAMEPSQRLRHLSQPDVRARMAAELRQTASLPPLERVFELGDPPDYEPPPDASIAARSRVVGRSPEAFLVDLLVQGDGRTLLYHPSLNYFDGQLDAVHEMLRHPHTVCALGDGGAHVGTICDASFPTFLLTHWARDRSRGERIPLEHVVHRQTGATAAAMGLQDRGVIAVGHRGDVNVIDLDALCLHPPAFVSDLPAGGTRLLQRADGYLHTFVSGTETYCHGEPTSDLPGRLVRGPQLPRDRTTR